MFLQLKNNTKQVNKGFTLLEILLVVAAMGILASIVIIAINPAKQLGDTRNAQRRSDVRALLDAVHQYGIDNNGALPGTITQTLTEICVTGGTCTNLIDLTLLTTNGKYLTSIPVEPHKTNADGAGYMIKKSTNNQVTVEAQFEEQSAIISITR